MSRLCTFVDKRRTLSIVLILATFYIYSAHCGLNYLQDGLSTHLPQNLNLNGNCSNGTQWIWKYFAECVTDTLQYVGFIIGLTSILCWLFAQLPQVITNYITGKADVALSGVFLITWLSGDVTNFVGSLLTHQLATQLAVSVYFVFMDVVMLSQYLYLWFRNRFRKKTKNTYTLIEDTTMLPVILIPMGITLLIVGTPLFLSGNSNLEQPGGYKSRTLMAINQNVVVDLNSWQDIVGYIIGWISGVLYVVSRIPQIVKNFQRKSVEGLSLPMFIMAVLGNLTYALGILFYSVDKIFLLRKLPWLVGSVGTLCFDFTIFVQFILFKYTIKSKKPRRLTASIQSPKYGSTNYPSSLDVTATFEARKNSHYDIN